MEPLRMVYGAFKLFLQFFSNHPQRTVWPGLKKKTKILIKKYLRLIVSPALGAAKSE